MTALRYRVGRDDVGAAAENLVALLARGHEDDPYALAGAAALAEGLRDLADCGAIARGLAKR